mmetsp:Transcript_37123/g.77727  ORF Transcript_37123/g.77727 Transcript_37123/m.77727 type:complete len:203 (+) Transcript_37123:319-927(+)
MNPLPVLLLVLLSSVVLHPSHPPHQHSQQGWLSPPRVKHTLPNTKQDPTAHSPPYYPPNPKREYYHHSPRISTVDPPPLRSCTLWKTTTIERMPMHHHYRPADDSTIRTTRSTPPPRHCHVHPHPIPIVPPPTISYPPRLVSHTIHPRSRQPGNVHWDSTRANARRGDCTIASYFRSRRELCGWKHWVPYAGGWNWKRRPTV